MCIQHRERKSVSLKQWHSSMCNTAASCPPQVFQVLGGEMAFCVMAAWQLMSLCDSPVHLPTLTLAKHMGSLLCAALGFRKLTKQPLTSISPQSTEIISTLHGFL